MDNCGYCGAKLPARTAKGPSRKYCSESHRSMAYRKRRVIAIEPDFVADERIPGKGSDPISLVDVKAIRPLAGAAPQTDAERLLALYRQEADRSGKLPSWALSAPEIGTRLSISREDGQAALRKLWGREITTGHDGARLVRP